MQRIASALNLTDAVVDLAHRYFGFYRDSLEKVNDMPKRVVQCLILVIPVPLSDNRHCEKSARSWRVFRNSMSRSGCKTCA